MKNMMKNCSINRFVDCSIAKRTLVMAGVVMGIAIGFAPSAQAVIDYTNVPYVSTDCEWETQYNPFAAPTTMAHWMSALVNNTCWTNYEGGFIVHQNGVVRENGFRTHWRCAGTWFLTTNHFDVVNMPDGNMKEAPLLYNNVEDRNFKYYSAAPENDTCLARIQQAAEAKLDGAGTDDTVGANLTIALCKLLRPHEARGPNHDGPHAYVVSNLFRYAKTPFREDPAGFCSGARLDYHSFNRVDPIINFHYTPISKNAETDPNVAPSAFLKAIYNQYGPGIKNCIETLDLVPDNWTGTYLLHNRDYGKQTVQEMTRFYEYDSTTPIMTNRTRVVTHPDAWPALDEDVYVDRGDVLVMKSLCYMVDSAFQMLQAYDLPGKKSGKWADNVCTNLTVVQESMHDFGYTHHGQANTNIIYRVGFSERIDQIIHDGYHQIPELLTNIVNNAALATARDEYLKSLECLLDADAFINGKATSVTGKSIVGARDPSQLHLIDFAEAESEDEGGEWNFAGWREFAEKTYASLKGKDTESAVQTLDLKDLGKKLDIHAGSMGNATDAQHGLVNFDGIGPDKDGKIKFDMNAFFDGKITRNDVILDGSLFQTNGPSRTVMTRWMITPDGAKSVYYNEWLIEQYPEYVKDPTAWMAKYPDVKEYMIKGSGARKHLYLFKSINRLHLTIGPKTLHSTLCGLYPSGTLFDDLLTMKTRYPANSATYRSGFSEMVDVYNCERAELESGESTNLVAGTYTAAPTTEAGGAFFLYLNATLTGTNVTFVGNEASNGGAIYALPSCVIKLVDAVFENNKSSRGGAIYNSTGAELTLENVTFRGNSPKTNGGAIANTPGGTVNFDGTVTLATETDTIYNTRELASATLNWNLANGKHGLLNGYQNINNTGTLKITVDDAIVVPTNFVIATGNFSNIEGKDTFTIANATTGASSVLKIGDITKVGADWWTLAVEGESLVFKSLATVKLSDVAIIDKEGNTNATAVTYASGIAIEPNEDGSYTVPQGYPLKLVYTTQDDYMFGSGLKQKTVWLDALTGDISLDDPQYAYLKPAVEVRWADSREIALDTRERIVVANPNDVLPIAYSTNYWGEVEGGNKVSLTVTPRGGVEQQLVSTNVNGYTEWMPTIGAYGMYDVGCMTERTMDSPVTTNTTIYYSTYFPLTIAEAEGGTLAAITNGIPVTGTFDVLGYEYVKLEATPTDNTWIFDQWTVMTNGGEVALFEDATNAVNKFEMPLTEVSVSGGFVIAEAYRAELLANATNSYDATTNAIEKLRKNRLTDDETNEALKKAKESFDMAVGAIGVATKPTDAKKSADALDTELNDAKKNAEEKSSGKPYDLIVADDFAAIADEGSYDPETGAFTVKGVAYTNGVNAFTSFRAAYGAADTAFTTNVHVYGTQMIEDDVTNLYPWTLDLNDAILTISIDGDNNLYASVTNKLAAIGGGTAIVFGKTDDAETRAIQKALEDKLPEGSEIVIKAADVTPEKKDDDIEVKVDKTTKAEGGTTDIPAMNAPKGDITITVDADVKHDTRVAGKVEAPEGTVTIVHEATNQALTVAGEVSANNVTIDNYGHFEADVEAKAGIVITNRSANTLVGDYTGATLDLNGVDYASISNATFTATERITLTGKHGIYGYADFAARTVVNDSCLAWSVKNGSHAAVLGSFGALTDGPNANYAVMADEDQNLGEYLLASNATAAVGRTFQLVQDFGDAYPKHTPFVVDGDTVYPGDSRAYTLSVKDDNLVLTVDHGKFAVKAETKKGEGEVAFTGAGYATGEAIVGTVVTNTAKPGTNWELRDWVGYYVNTATNELTFANPSNAVTTFTMPVGDVTVEAYFRVAKTYEQEQIDLVMTNAYKAIAELNAKTLTQAEKDALYASITNKMWTTVTNIQYLAAYKTPGDVYAAQHTISTNLDAVVDASEALVQGRIRFAESKYTVTEGETAEIVVYGGSETRSVSATVTLQKNTLSSYKATMMVDGKEKKVSFPLTLSWPKGAANVPQTIWIQTKKSSKVNEDKFLTLQLGSQVGVDVGTVSVCTLTVRDEVMPTPSSKEYVRALAWPANGGKVSGSGVLKSGKTRTLKAKPKTYKHEKWVWDPYSEQWFFESTVIGKAVFVGWYAAKADDANMIDLGKCVSTDKKLKVSVAGTYYAYFTEVMNVIDVADPDFGAAGVKGVIEVTNAYNTAEAFTGVQFALPVSYDAKGDAKAKLIVRGLPSGLKYDKKTRTIKGVPKKAGAYEVTMIGKNASGKQIITFYLIVNELEAAKIGKWVGVLADATGLVGEVRIKVSKKGKIITRVKYGKKSYGMNVNGYEMILSNRTYTVSVAKDKVGTLKADFSADGSLTGTVTGEKFGTGASFTASKTK